MKVLVLSNGNLEEREIENKLEDLQKIVDGYIEVPFLSYKFSNNKIDIIINEEGKLIQGMNPEIAIVDEDSGKILDIVYGNCIFASHNDEGDTIELNNKQKAIVEKELSTIAVLTNPNTFKHYEVRTLFI